MKLQTLNNEKQIIYESKNTLYATIKLLSALWSKYIIQNKSIKRIEFNYNYTDKQKIEIVYDNNYKDIITDIPTSWGILNDTEIINEIEKEVK